jgi:hypothetical protein
MLDSIWLGAHALCPRSRHQLELREYGGNELRNRMCGALKRRVGLLGMTSRMPWTTS